MKISGFITPMEKDKSGNILRVAVEDDQFNKYVVVIDKKNSELLKFINKNVVLSADVIDYDYNERPILNVKKVIPLNQKLKGEIK
jgi:hypothetical protein